MSDFKVGMEIGTLADGKSVALSREFHRALDALAGRPQQAVQAQVGTSAAAMLTATSQGTLSAVSVHNASGSAVILEVWLDISGTAGAVDATKIHNASLSAGATVSPGADQRLLSGGKVYMQADTANALTATLTLKG